MYEIITTRATFWATTTTRTQGPGWPNIIMAQTYVNGWVMNVAYDSLRPAAQDDLDQGNTFIVQINPAEVVAVVDLGDQYKPTQ